jgi:hypothetical protein
MSISNQNMSVYMSENLSVSVTNTCITSLCLL